LIDWSFPISQQIRSSVQYSTKAQDCLLFVGSLDPTIIGDGCGSEQLGDGEESQFADKKEHDMQPSVPTDDKLIKYYTNAIDALWKIARAYYMDGKLSNALHLLRTALQLTESGEIAPRDHLKLLLLYGQVLVVNHLARGDADLLFSTVRQARQIAEATQDQQGIADALSLLGQAHYFTAVVASLKAGTLLNSHQGDGKYDEALAYQQQALKLRESLHDNRGISESYFQIGTVYERWGQYDRAQEYYTKARQIADQYDYPFEKTEPARHLALHALRQGDLDQALTLALQALELREKAGFKPYQPLDHLLIRDVYQAQEDTVNAQLHEQRASAIAEEMGLPELVSSVPSMNKGEQ
jgi:tetratricopeptide (TPR) repeat protein